MTEAEFRKKAQAAANSFWLYLVIGCLLLIPGWKIAVITFFSLATISAISSFRMTHFAEKVRQGKSLE